MVKMGALARIKKRRAAKLEEKRNAALDARSVPAPAITPSVPVIPLVEPEIIEALKKQVAEHKALAENAAKSPKLVRSGRAIELAAQADEKATVLAKMEAANAVPAAPPASVAAPPVSDIHVALSVFEQAMVVLSVGAETLKISKWYALGGAAGIAVLYFIAEKQGWLAFINF